MMSFQGLVQLVSLDGFEHLSQQECEDRAKEGCPLCKFFYDFSTQSGLWEHVTQPLILDLSPGVDDPSSLLSGEMEPGDIVSALSQRSSEARYLIAQPNSDQFFVAKTPVFTTECRLPILPRDA
jgi:hypothetical protein